MEIIASKPKKKKIQSYDIFSIISLVTAIIPAALLIGVLVSASSTSPYAGANGIAILYFMSGIGFIMFPISIIFGTVALKKQNKHRWSRILAILGIGVNVIVIVGMIIGAAH